jgi:hypothetical protein
MAERGRRRGGNQIDIPQARSPPQTGCKADFRGNVRVTLPEYDIASVSTWYIHIGLVRMDEWRNRDSGWVSRYSE